MDRLTFPVKVCFWASKGKVTWQLMQKQAGQMHFSWRKWHLGFRAEKQCRRQEPLSEGLDFVGWPHSCESNLSSGLTESRGSSNTSSLLLVLSLSPVFHFFSWPCGNPGCNPSNSVAPPARGSSLFAPVIRIPCLPFVRRPVVRGVASLSRNEGLCWEKKSDSDHNIFYSSANELWVGKSVVVFLLWLSIFKNT